LPAEILIIFAGMKQAQIIHQYIWLINTLKAHRALTLDELKSKWRDDEVADGNPLNRSTLTRHRRAIFDMFGIIIEADASTYKYSIRNANVLTNGSIEQWLYSTLSVHGVLAESVGMKERVVLENIPSGAEFLSTIIHAFHTGHRLRMGYQKFNAEGYVKTVCPYALKLFHQRWYLLALNDEKQLRIYALDRISELTATDETFEIPDDFSPQDYFSEYFGVLTTDTPMAHVVIRAHDYTPNYLRTLPLHHSQREVATTDTYADFAFDIRPTHDFLGQLLSHGAGIEVLSPPYLREQMRQKFIEGLKRY
jgi:hypothetical protein